VWGVGTASIAGLKTGTGAGTGTTTGVGTPASIIELWEGAFEGSLPPPPMTPKNKDNKGRLAILGTRVTTTKLKRLLLKE